VVHELDGKGVEKVDCQGVLAHGAHDGDLPV
jgi:hypothetical protein